MLIDTAGYDSLMASCVNQKPNLIFIPTGEPGRASWERGGPTGTDMIRQSDMPVVAANVPSLTGFEKMTWTGGHPEGTAAMAMREFVAELQMEGLIEFYADRDEAA